jgi:RNA polymerase sigma-70 factor (ECF subfamily)
MTIAGVYQRMHIVLREDHQLLSSWAAGDEEAGNQLIERCFDPVYRFFRNKTRDADVEDLVQQTFLACLEAHARYESRSSLVTFLLAIARNQLFNYYRSHRREQITSRISSLVDLKTSPTGAVAKLEDMQLLIEALLRVPLDAQVILELAYVEELAGGEIAEVLGIAVGAVHTRLHRARQSLRESLSSLAPDRVALAERLRELRTEDA